MKLLLSRVGALSLLLAGMPVAHADYVFQLDPQVVTAPASLGFSNSTSQGTLTLSTGATLSTAPYNFLDRWQFTVAGDADIAGFVGSINFTSLPGGVVTNGINNLQLALVGPGVAIQAWTTVGYVGPGVQQVFSVIPASNGVYEAGDYELRVRGQLQGDSSAYAGTVSAISAVPLPAALPLFAAGLAAFTALSVRRRRV